MINEYIRAAHFSHPELHFYLRSHQNHLRLAIITRWRSAAAIVHIKKTQCYLAEQEMACTQ